MMIIVAGAAMLAACSDTIKLNNDITSETKTEKIGFAVYSEKATRADQTNSVNLYDFYKAFDVYAWKTVNDSVQSVFSHTPVEYFTKDSLGTYVYKTDPAKPSDEWGEYGEGKDWTKGWFYENIRYWDKLATAYNFYAIAPYEVTPSPAITITNGQDNITIGATNDRYMVSTEKNLAVIGDTTLTKDRQYFGFNKDYMLAEKFGTKFQLVSLNFHHILTKLNVKITLTDKYKGIQTFTIKDLKIARLEDNAYFDYDTDMTTNGWHTDGTSKYDIQIKKDYILKNVPDSVKDTIEYSGYYWIQTLIFPQTLTCAATGAKATEPTGKYLYIEYTIGDETFRAYYDLAYVFDNTLDIDGTYDIAQGSEYTINIKVGPDPIEFEAKSTKWAEETEINHIVD